MSIKKYCASCGRAHELSDTYCNNCGAALRMPPNLTQPDAQVRATGMPTKGPSRMIYLLAGLGVLAIGLWVGAYLTYKPASSLATQPRPIASPKPSPAPTVAAVAVPSPVASPVDPVRGKEPLASPWDGKVYCVDRYLSSVLNDYNGAEYVEWSPIVPGHHKGEPCYIVRLRLRAANAFGGKVLKDVIFYIDHDRVIAADNL